MNPTEIKIVGKTYAVKWLDKVDDKDSLGEHELSTQVIKVKNEQHFESARETLLHETMHAVDEQMNLSMREGQIHSLAVGLFQVFRDNPDFVKFITEKQKRRGK